MMNQLYLLIIAIFTFSAVSAQTDGLPLYEQFPDVPPFSIIRVPDSTVFQKSNLAKKKPTLIILFSPDCEHCQHETQMLKAEMNLLHDVQIVMISFMDYNLVKKFYDEYGIAATPNITMGRDEKFFLGSFYKMQTYPSLYLYNKKGKFVQKFEGNVAVKKIADAF